MLHLHTVRFAATQPTNRASATYTATNSHLHFGAKKKIEGERDQDISPSEKLNELNRRAEEDFPEETPEDRDLINRALIFLFGSTNNEPPAESNPPEQS